MRRYVKDNLSPTDKERSMMSEVYAEVGKVLGVKNCIQVGSYARFTSIRPIHDLDCLYMAGNSTDREPDPRSVLKEIARLISEEFKNPTSFAISVTIQSHSVTISFGENAKEVFAVDIVPGYAARKNEFGDDVYLVPEIENRSPNKRRKVYSDLALSGRKMQWILSDPRGYIAVAASINKQNEDFRRAVKFVKGWRSSCKRKSSAFALKSFHLEQAITRHFAGTAGVEIFDAIFSFFCALPQLLDRPQFIDRANPSRFIDDYVAKLTVKGKAEIVEARDHFLIALEGVQNASELGVLFSGERRKRAGTTEAYLFDQRIPTLTESALSITSKVLDRPGFREYFLDAIGLIEAKRKIQFRVGERAPDADLFKWKVKNDDSSPQPRGEITDHRTRNDPEETRYKGRHQVECYAIKNGVCIAKAKQTVQLNREWI